MDGRCQEGAEVDFEVEAGGSKGVGVVCTEEASTVDLAARKEGLRGLVEIDETQVTEDEYRQLQSLVMEAHDVFVVEDGEHGEVRDVLRESCPS